MELIERLPLKPIQWLAQLTRSEFENQCLSADGAKAKKKDRDARFTMLKQFCKTNLKTKGVTTRIYSYSTNTPAGLGGRLFCGGSLQGMPSIVRGLLMGDIGTDIDMAAAHQYILRYICKLHDISCPNLEYYINHRDDCLAKFESREVGKVAYLKATNNDKMNRSKKLPDEFKKYDLEMKRIQKVLSTNITYQGLFDTIPTTKQYNYNGSAINRILCYFENVILQHAIHVVNQRNIEIAILMFDGLMLYGNHYEDKGLLQEITDYVETQMPGLGMKWTYKEHNTSLSVPDDFKEPEIIHIDEDHTFEHIAKEFEKNHLKIINKSLYIKHDSKRTLYLTQAQLRTSYSHMSYEVPKYDKHGACCDTEFLPFIDKWIGHTHKILHKEDADMYPNEGDCPDNIFNLWKPFAMELKTGPYTKNLEALAFILFHIHILCNHEEIVYDYFIKWIAQMIQYPHIKTPMPTFIGKQGCGKSCLMKLFELFFGSDKIFETTSPSRDVWGNFNGMMSNCFLVNLNELCKKDGTEAEGKIKGLITDESLTINQKGIGQYTIKSFHRFIATTNKEEPMNSSEGDRRNLIIRSSDEKKGDVEYFNKFHEYLSDEAVVRTCYDYFKSIPNMDQFKKIPLPQTDYQNNLKELSRSPIEQWLESFTREHIGNNNDNVELFGVEIYELFKTWCATNGVKYEINALKLGVKLTNLKLNGISKGRHTKKGDTKMFNIQELKNTLNLGCLIKGEE
jgi:hypothetical protein